MRDVISSEVHRKALQNLTNEMAITLVRTSGSPIVTEAKDFSTCILDNEPDHLAFSAYVLFHVGSSLLGTRSICEKVDPAKIEPGDGWIVNDPHQAGAMHQGDVSVIMPTFYGSEHLGWSFANMHVLDVGGVGISGYAPGAHDVFQEGLRFPPVRIIRDGAIDPEWETFITANVRTPGPVLNDIRSMVAANNTASRKLTEILDRFGVEDHQAYCRINKDLSEQVLRERIERLPDGLYEASEWNEFDGHDGPDRLLELSVQLEVSGSDLRFAYTGAPQIDAYVNSVPGAMFGQTMTALMTLMLYGDVPINGGIFRPISVDLGEPGTIVNATEPAPVSNAHTEVGARACKLAKDVLCQALALSEDEKLRGRVAGMCHDGVPGNALSGINQHGGISVTFYPDSAIGSGGGAQTVGDGQDGYGMTCSPGGGIPDIETHEAADPVLFLWRHILPNSGGPGQTRGGSGIEQAYLIHSSDLMAGPAFNSCAQVPPRGFGGGYPAGAASFYPLVSSNAEQLLETGVLPSKDRLSGDRKVVPGKVTHLSLGRGDVFVVESGGGGGLGDPLLRPPEQVALDCRSRHIDPEHAREAFGVVVGAAFEVDAEATERTRAEMRAERIGGAPPLPAQPPSSPGVSVLRADRSWSCASCSTTLQSAEGNWRDGAVARERPIAERFAELRMIVRDRREPPAVILREFFCPGCASALGVDVATEGYQQLGSPILAESA